MGIFNLFKKKQKEKVWDKTMQVQLSFREWMGYKKLQELSQ
jgi:hypothetical protein